MIKKTICLLIIFCGALSAQSKIDKIDQLIKVYNENRLFSGTVLVSERGKIIYNKGIGLANMEWDIPNTPDTKFRLGSITKQFTAAIILQLAEQGKLKLEDKITDILSDYPEKTGSKITVHNLLTHSSGIPNYTDDPEYFRDYARKNMSVKELLALFNEKDLNFEPGTKWAYSNSGYIVLGAIIEKATGKSYEDVLKENILEPLEMKNTGYDHFQEIITKRATGYDKTPDGYRNSDFLDMSGPYAAGAMYSTTEDLFKWDQALYTNKILSEDSRKKAFTGYFDAFGGAKYGYGWMTKYIPSGKDDSTLVIQHGGGIFGFNTMIFREIEDNNCIILLNNTPSANLGEMCEIISKIIYDMPYDMPKKSAGDKLYVDYMKSGIEKAVENYRDLKNSNNKDYNFSEGELNILGYNFLLNKKRHEALAVFKLNTDLFPASANVFDSYGEALLASGDTTASIINYKKSLELDKKNYNAVSVLKKLNVDVSAYESINPEILKSYIGKYQLTPEFIIEVTVDNDKIFIQATGQPRFEIFPETPTKYFLKVVEAKMDFVKEGDKITHFILHQNGQDMKCVKMD